jgi:putative transcriptional regulator
VAPSQTDHEISVRLDALLKERGLSAAELSKRTGITEANLSKLKNGRVTAVWFSTLTALCRELDCQIGDLLVFVPAGKE